MATPTINILSARSLTQAIQNVVIPEPFVLNTLFKADAPHAADNIDCEFDSFVPSMARFVKSHGEAVSVAKGSRYIQQFKIPRTFEKITFEAQEMADYRALGSIYEGNPTAVAQVKNEWVMRNIERLKDRVVRRREWMAIQAITTGHIIVSEEDISFDYNYGFTSDNLITLGATEKWNATSPKIAGTIKNWKKAINQRCGYPMDILMLGEQAATDFMSDDLITKQLWASRINVGNLELSNAPTVGANYLGTFMGVKVYEIDQQYYNGSTQVDMFGTNLAVAVASGAAFRKHTGPVNRFNPSTGEPVSVSTEFYIQPIVNEDQTVVEWKSEQKSLPVVHQPGAVIAATVHV